MFDTLYNIDNGEWYDLKIKIPTVNIEERNIPRSDVVIPTIDTERIKSQIHYLLTNNRVLIMCGPPGTGKTMSIMN